MEEKSLFIGEIAKQTGVNPKTIRYMRELTFCLSLSESGITIGFILKIQ